ncbi:MAG TPA: GNAT family N-acetyltransferase [Thermomicrobiales bacterium]|nr:GNAT family N-acetyltransferase [Thermomicrobiales bacterium]
MARVGEDVVIRAAQSDDAAALLDLKLALDRETSYMMFEPGERQADADAVARELEEIVAAPNSVVLVADAGDELAGYVEARGGEFRRVRHVATVIAGVRQSYAGQGLGSRLFQALMEWAEDAGLARLELTVMTHNAAAIRLYEKFGFEREGTRRMAMRVDGAWVDEYYMARLSDGFAGRGENG